MSEIKKEIEETKALQRFRERLNSLRQNLELLDASLKVTERQCRCDGNTLGRTISEKIGYNKGQYKRLDIPSKSQDIDRTYASVRITLHEHTLINLYRFFSDYMENIVKELIQANKCEALLKQIKSDSDYKLKYSEIIELDYNKEKIVESMAGRIYRKLEGLKSTTELLDRILKQVGLSDDVSADLKMRALVYLNMRHLIIHRNSTADATFKDDVKRAKLNASDLLKNDNKLRLNFRVSSNAIDEVDKLCRDIDKGLIRKKIVLKRSIICPNKIKGSVL